MFVKICGITNAVDATQALEAGADAIGLVLAEGPRRIDADTARGIIRALPEQTLAVAVFRHQSAEVILEIVRSIGVGAAQIHGNPPADVRLLRHWIPFLIEAVPMGDGGLERIEESEADLVMVDSGAPGSGRTFDWSALAGAPRHRLVLAGGLNPDNVTEAIEAVRPHGVDVATGVEAEPGRKDHQKVRLFIDRARRGKGGRDA